jgi:hypothetical protein
MPEYKNYRVIEPFTEKDRETAKETDYVPGGSWSGPPDKAKKLLNRPKGPLISDDKSDDKSKNAESEKKTTGDSPARNRTDKES